MWRTGLSGRLLPDRGRWRSRPGIVVMTFATLYLVIGARLVEYAMSEPTKAEVVGAPAAFHRPPIVDRNGRTLAVDLKTYSLFAEPRRIEDVDEAVERLRTVLPDLEPLDLHSKLSSKRGFIWLKRHLTPRLHNKIMALGLPGVGFRSDIKRFYPAGRTTSHIVGLSDVDNLGVSGMEKHIDALGYQEIRRAGLADKNSFAPVTMSIDIRIQHAAHDESEVSEDPDTEMDPRELLQETPHT